MKTIKKATMWSGVVLLIAAASSALVLAQYSTDGGDGALKSVAAEIRLLRLAVEQLGQDQARTQALTASLSAQQGQLSQVTARLDAAQRTLDAANARSQAVESGLTDMLAELSRTTEAGQRAALEDQIRGLRSEQREVDLALQQARNRESELFNAMQIEQSRWNDFIARLEQLVAR